MNEQMPSRLKGPSLFSLKLRRRPCITQKSEQFVNTSEKRPQAEIIKDVSSRDLLIGPMRLFQKLTAEQLKTLKGQRTWVTVVI